MKGLLESPLPRPYIIDDNGEVVPETTDVEIVGSGVQVERITTASQVMQARLHEEVHIPLQQWLMAYETTKVTRTGGVEFGHREIAMLVSKVTDR